MFDLELSWIGLIASSTLVGTWLGGLTWRAVRGTVLRGATIWAGLTLVAAATVATWSIVTPSSPNLPAWRWLVLALSACPFIARLGAKRPQDRAWHVIVATFWIIAGLPAWESVLFHRPLALDGIRTALMVTVVVMPIADCLGTRIWLAPWLFATAQLVVHPQWLRMAGIPSSQFAPTVSLVLGVAAGAVVAWGWRPPPKSIAGPSRVWQAFRDRMGVLWSLRFLERFNADMSVAGQPIRLRWDGFFLAAAESATPLADGETAMELPPVAEQAFENLLRRFVDASWISAHGAELVGSDQGK